MNINLNTIKKKINLTHLKNKKERLLCSFSGGPDSVFMIELLTLQGYKNIELIYFNHNLRPQKKIKKEIEYIKHFSTIKQLKLTIKTLPIQPFKLKNKLSIEEAGRLLRRIYLNHIAKLRSINKILMAHHFDDQIESILMRYEKGSNFKQFPLQPVSKLSDNISIIRPLLALQKKEILAYLTKHNQSFSTDETNKNMLFKRNKIRHEWIPLLNGINPKIVDMIYKTQHILERYYQGLQLARLKTSIYKKEYHIHIDTERKNIAETLYNTILEYYSNQVTIHPMKKIISKKTYITSKHIYSILDLIQNHKVGHHIALPKNIICYKSKNAILLMDKNHFKRNIKFKGIITQHNTEIVLDQHKATVFYQMLKAVPKSIESTDETAFFNIKNSQDMAIKIRHINKYDSFQPLGTKKNRNILNYLKKQQCDTYTRKQVPIVLINDVVAWAVGYTISEPFKLSQNNNTIIKINIKKIMKNCSNK